MYSRMLLVAVMLLPFVSLAAGVEPGYVGVDAYQGDIASLSTSSAAACALACDGRSDCAVWVWSYPGNGCPANANTCWLKNKGIGARLVDPCREIGYAAGDVGRDRVGGDMAGMPLVLGGGSGPSTCATACKSTAGCVAWSFDSCGKQNCWLKNSVNGANDNNCRTSGVLGNQNSDMVGNDIGSQSLPASATTTDCSDLCANTPGCNSWSYVTPGPGCETTNTCWLKSSGSAAGTFSPCRSSLSQANSAPPPPPPSGPQCGNGNICHYNKCNFVANIWQVGNGAAAFQACSLAQGASCDTNVPGGWAGNFKIGWQGQSLAEFQINGWNNIDFYDISYIVGFDFGMKIESTNGGPTLNCPQDACDSAYHQPNDVQTHTTATGGKFIVTWCP